MEKALRTAKPTQPHAQNDSKDCIIFRTAFEVKGTKEDPTIHAIRNHRDTVLCQSPNTKKIVDEYYTVSPTLVKKLEAHPEAKQICQAFYRGLEQLAHTIETGNHDEAVFQWKNIWNQLQKKLN